MSLTLVNDRTYEGTTMPPAEDKLNGRAAVKGRDAQRQQTRQRVYAAALAEFKRTGMAAADVGDIATAAGVARGTFYFHFPTKEHVLAELERHEEARLVAQLSKFLTDLEARCGQAAERPTGVPAGQGFLPAALGEVVRLLTAMERRVGKTLFREMLGLHFSSRRPEVLPGSDQWTEYPVMTVVVEVVERARERGEVHPDASALPTAQLFMVGLYAMLIASHEYPKAARAEILDNFMATVLRGVAPR
jgi:TetR/AcrR family transcriptional regulator, repressor for uid operon